MGTRHAGAAVLGICYSFFWHQEVVAVTCSRLGLPVVTCCSFWEEVVVATCSCLELPVVTFCYFWEEAAAVAATLGVGFDSLGGAIGSVVVKNEQMVYGWLLFSMLAGLWLAKVAEKDGSSGFHRGI